jgi:hypothetical protein
LEGLLVQILTSEPIRTESRLEILLTGLGFVFLVTKSLALKLMLSMSKTASISKFASSSKLPILAELSFVLPFIVFDKLLAFFCTIKLLPFRADTNQLEKT